MPKHLDVTADRLLEDLATNRGFLLSGEIWTVAAILAGLRVAANDPIRASDRDRGEDKNWLADIWGTLGELIALRAIDRACDLPVQHHPIDFERSVDAVDITIQADDRPVPLEAKAHLIAPGKDWFMINDRAHHRSVRRGAIGYIPVLSVLGGQRALVGPLLPVDEVERWGAPRKRLRDPARGLEIHMLSRAYFGLELVDAHRKLQSDVLVSERALHAEAASAGRHFDSWRATLPPLGKMHARELVDTVLAARRQIVGT